MVSLALTLWDALNVEPGEISMKLCMALVALSLTFVSLGGCVGPRPCPPGSHPGPYGHRCFLN